jgi:hypothetical protein
MQDPPEIRSFLLRIPTELRLQIYDYCLADGKCVTITAAPVTVFGQCIRDTARRDIYGLPRQYSPLVRCGYDPTLLSLAKPVTINLDGGAASRPRPCDRLAYPAHLALVKTCHMIRGELRDYMRKRRLDLGSGGLSIYVTYPYGVVVLKELYPFLLCQAKNIYISGYHNVAKHALDQPTRNSRRNRQSVARARNSGSTIAPRKSPYVDPRIGPEPMLALENIVRSVSSLKQGLLAKIEARILYPGDSQSNLWGDESGPVVNILRTLSGGKIDMDVRRGRRGCGIHLRAEPDPHGRNVRTYWNRLGESVEQFEGFVIGPNWPERA